ncbi:phosphotransferase enzyme family protein [Neobacillus vireti]|uniref:phosphotransferase enzyme family protein n=1 Tax=Neobacillus vireti TaxID=220686 RepID=UPI002FFD6E56
MKDLKRLCREYKIGRLLEVEDLLGGGYINANLKIRTSKGKYVVRIFLKEVEEDQLQYAYSIVSELSKAGAPALLPLLNQNGLPYARYKEFIVQITPFVEANRFLSVPEQAYHSGKMLRRIHGTLASIMESPKSTGVYHYYQLDPTSIMKSLQEEGHTLPRHKGTAIDNLFRMLHPLVIDTSNLPKTIIHGDWNPSNQLYRENNEVHCFLDFDTLQRGERIFDVAYALYFFLIQKRNKVLCQAFLKGYGGLTKQEISVLPNLIVRIGLYFAILVDQGDFKFARNKVQMEWLISDKGRKTVQGFCIRGA